MPSSGSVSPGTSSAKASISPCTASRCSRHRSDNGWGGYPAPPRPSGGLGRKTGASLFLGTSLSVRPICIACTESKFVLAGHSRSKNGVAALAYVPAIHALAAARSGVDARHKAGHDEREACASNLGITLAPAVGRWLITP